MLCFRWNIKYTLYILSIEVNYWLHTKLQPEDWNCQRLKCRMHEQSRAGGDEEEMVEKKGGDICYGRGLVTTDSRVTKRLLSPHNGARGLGCWGMSRGNARAISGHHHHVLLPGPEEMPGHERWGQLRVRVGWLISNVSKKCDGWSVTGSRALQCHYPGCCWIIPELRGRDYEYCINRGLFISDPARLLRNTEEREGAEDER